MLSDRIRKWYRKNNQRLTLGRVFVGEGISTWYSIFIFLISAVVLVGCLGSQKLTSKTTPTVTIQPTPTEKIISDDEIANLLEKGVVSEPIAIASGEVQSETIASREIKVSQVFPADTAMDIANNAVITVIFNQPIVPLTVMEEQTEISTLLEIIPAIPGRGEWINTSVYVYRPSSPLIGGQTYSVTVKKGLKNATQSQELKENYQWSFTVVQPSIAALRSSRGAENPQDGYPNVFLDEYFFVEFHQPMDKTSTQEALTLQQTNGENVTLTTTWNDANTQMIITPTVRLALGTNYVLSLDREVAKSSDGGKLSKGIFWNFMTLEPPAVVFTTPAYGERQSVFSSEFQIKFISPMNIASVKDRIHITPQPKESLEWWYNDWDWSIHTYNLEPSTYYTVQLEPGMEDIYGNPITAGKTIQFTTGAYQPQAYLQMPYTPSLFRSGDLNTPQEFYLAYRNVKTVQVELYRIDVKQFISFQTGSLSQWEYFPPPSSLVWQNTQKSSGKLNQLVLEKLTITQENGLQLEPGFYFIGINSPEITSKTNPYVDTRLLVVANANVTFKTTSNEALMWLTDLTIGSPIKDVSLTVYDGNFTALGNGRTDSEGLVYLKIPATGESYAPRYVLSDDEQIFGFAFNQWDSGVSFDNFGSWGMYYAPANQPVGYIYTDRPIYRPGQPVYFKGIVRIDDDLNYQIPPQKEIKITIRSFEEVISEQYLPISDFGSFSSEFKLDSEATLGYYTISANFRDSEFVLGEVGFSVAEYRKPEFRLEAHVEPKEVSFGEKFLATVKAEYYSGGAVSNSPVHWTLTSDRYYFVPPDDFSSYSFYDYDEDNVQYELPEVPLSEVIAEGDATLDTNGQLKKQLPAEIKDAKSDFTLTFEATATDIAGNQVSGRDRLIVHRSLLYAGIKPETYVAQVNKSTKFDIALLDWYGEPVPDQNVNVEIVERRWYSVQEQDATGRILWKSSVQDIPVVAFDQVTTSQDGKAQVEFIPPNGGTFKAKVTAIDSNGNSTVGATFLWISGVEYVPWRQTNDRNLTLVANKKNYLPGEEAEILIASPYQGEAYALVSVERGHIYSHEVVILKSNSTIYKLPIGADMAPNIYVSVVVVKGIDENNLRPDYKMGVVELKIAPLEQKITVEILPDKETVKPGDVVNYTITTRNEADQPVKAEVSFGLSDLATLSLVDPNSRPIMDYFYSTRSLGVWTSMPLNLSIEEYNALMSENLLEGKSMGSGGGKGGGEFGVVEIRQEFPDTAAWEAHLVTDENGKANITVTLPDNLTTWRSDVRAVTKDTLVGQNIVDIVSTKPLIVRPQTPRFFVADDQAWVGATVQNNANEKLNVKINLTAEGVSIENQSDQQMEIQPNSSVYASWKVTVDSSAQRVDMVFAAKSDQYSDTSRPTLGTLENNGLPVYRYFARENVGTSGMLTEAGAKTEVIQLPTSLKYDSGELNISVEPSLAAGITDGLTYLEHYPYECVEQTISRFLPNVISVQAMRASGLTDASLEANLKTQIDIALQRLYNWQNPDGGWGWWSRQKSDTLTTAYVVLGLAETKKADYLVNDVVFNRAVDFLKSQLLPASKIGENYELNRQVFLLYVLNRTGNPDVSRASMIYDRRQNMGLYARALLAEIFYTNNPEDKRIETILSDLVSNAVLSASGAHWQEKEEDTRNWNTDTRTTAIILSVLSQIKTDDPVVINAVRWLMSNRIGGHWRGTQETAWTLMALTHWMESSGEMAPDYKYAVLLNGKLLGENRAQSKNIKETLQLRIDVTELIREQMNNVAFVRTEGNGNLYYTAMLSLSLPVSEIKSLDKGIIVSRDYYELDDLSKPVREAKVGDVLMAKITIINPADLHYILVNDPLPSGLEAIDQSLLTSIQEGSPQNLGLIDTEKRGWGWWYFEHVELRDEKVVLSVDYLPAGTYEYTYLVRAVIPGTFLSIPPVAEEFYFPDVYGRGTGGIFTIKQ